MTTLKELKELDAKAKKGPWNCQDKNGRWLSDKSDWTAELNREAKGGCSSSVPIQNGLSKNTLALVVWEGWADTEPLSNAQLIAAARNALPDLIRVIELAEEALVEIIDEYRRNIKEHNGSYLLAVTGKTRAKQALTEIKKLKGE